jgi:hypothetical protein
LRTHVRSHSWCCVFYDFWETFNDIYPPLECYAVSSLWNYCKNGTVLPCTLHPVFLFLNILDYYSALAIINGPILILIIYSLIIMQIFLAFPQCPSLFLVAGSHIAHHLDGVISSWLWWFPRLYLLLMTLTFFMYL